MTHLIWKRLALPETEISLCRVLRCGQTFRWKCIDDVWSLSLDDRIVLVRQHRDYIEFSDIPLQNRSLKSERTTAEFIHDYFNLSVKLSDLYAFWSRQHTLHHKRPKLESPFDLFKGIRILRQDPWETTVSFICSSNNNVKRISKMCESLCENFGQYVGEYHGIPHYSFPTPQALSSSNVESRLRELGFGYRAKYIYQTACKMTSHETPDISPVKLASMRSESYDTAHEFLLQLAGVGPKVADCICLMALDKHDIVPVDTHVYQIATREYKYSGKPQLKTMNKVVYLGIREYFKQVFGPYAGWAQLVLFASDLSDLVNGQNVSNAGTVKQERQNVSTTKSVEQEQVKQEVSGSLHVKAEQGDELLPTLSRVKIEHADEENTMNSVKTECPERSQKTKEQKSEYEEPNDAKPMKMETEQEVAGLAANSVLLDDTKKIKTEGEEQLAATRKNIECARSAKRLLLDKGDLEHAVMAKRVTRRRIAV